MKYGHEKDQPAPIPEPNGCEWDVDDFITDHDVIVMKPGLTQYARMELAARWQHERTAAAWERRLSDSTHDMLHAEGALSSIVNSYGYKLNAEMAYKLASDYFSSCKGKRYVELDEMSDRITELTRQLAESSERSRQFKIAADKALDIIKERDALKAELDESLLCRANHAIKNALAIDKLKSRIEKLRSAMKDHSCQFQDCVLEDALLADETETE